MYHHQRNFKILTYMLRQLLDILNRYKLYLKRVIALLIKKCSGHGVQKLEKCQSRTRDINFVGIYAKTIQVINFLAENSIPNIKAVAQILFETSCTKTMFQHSKKGHNFANTGSPEKGKNTGQLFFHKQLIYEI